MIALDVLLAAALLWFGTRRGYRLRETALLALSVVAFERMLVAFDASRWESVRSCALTGVLSGIAFASCLSTRLKREARAALNEALSTHLNEWKGCETRMGASEYRDASRARVTDRVILKVEGLRTYFRTEAGIAKAVDGVDFSMREGEVLGIVGESGSGKSVTALSMLRLIPDPPGFIDGGKIVFQGEDLLVKDAARIRSIRGREISMIFQEPMTSLNPVFSIADQVAESFQVHHWNTDRDGLTQSIARLDRFLSNNSGLLAGWPLAVANEVLKILDSMRGPDPAQLVRAKDILEAVGIPAVESRLSDFPHQFSGGMRQRVMIAMALVLKPSILIADEPTTALDVTIQAQILELMLKMKEETGGSIILITHDMAVVAETCHRVVVMYCGKVQEIADIDDIFYDPLHPYTVGLLKSLPDPRTRKEHLFTIPGMVPSLFALPRGCSFCTRCPEKKPVCEDVVPPLIEVKPGHHVRCHLYPEVKG